MKKPNILITAAGGDIGGNVIQILSNYRDVIGSLIGTDLSNNIFAFKMLDTFYTIMPTNHPSYLNAILQIIKNHSIDYIIPLSEHEIRWFDAHRVVFQHHSIKVLINNPNIVETFFNKLKTSSELNKINVQTPETFLLTEYTNQLSFPLILKSIFSINDKTVQTVQNQQQLDCFKAMLQNPENYLIQQYIGTLEDEYTTTLYQYRNRKKVITFKRKLTGGMTSYASIANEPLLETYAYRIADHFNLQGSINIQSRKLGEQFYIFEINPRFSSTVYIRHHFGFHDLLWWLNDLFESALFPVNEISISLSGEAILGYQYQFFNTEGKI